MLSRDRQGYSPEIRLKNNSRKRLNQSVDESFIPNIDYYVKYLQEQNLNNSDFSKLLNDFASSKINLDNIKYDDYLEHLIDNHILKGNRKLFSHIKQTLEHLVENNLLHVNKKNVYMKTLADNLFSENQDFKIENTNKLYTVIDYSQYDNRDFRKVYHDQVLNELFNKGGEIFFTKKNKIALKLSNSDKLEEYPIRTAEKILSKYFDFNIEITDDVMEYDDIDYEDFIFESSEYTVFDR